jgi:hypothetical protein
MGELILIRVRGDRSADRLDPRRAGRAVIVGVVDTLGAPSPLLGR